MKLADCWITYAAYYATGEGMHHALAIAQVEARAKQLFDASVRELFRGDSVTAPLDEALQKWPAIRNAIPQEVLQRADDPRCWTLEYFGTVDFNCA